MKKFLRNLLIVLMVMSCVFALAACGSVGEQGPKGDDGKSAYQTWLDNGHSGTEADFLNWLKGADGTNGINGTNGASGPQGPAGPQGVAGPQGTPGADGAQGPQGVPGPQGAPGVDAILNAVAVYVSTAQEFLDALNSKRQYIVLQNDIRDFEEVIGFDTMAYADNKINKIIIGQYIESESRYTNINAAFHVTDGAHITMFNVDIVPTMCYDQGNDSAAVFVGNGGSLEMYNCRVSTMYIETGVPYGIYVTIDADYVYLEDVTVDNSSQTYTKSGQMQTSIGGNYAIGIACVDGVDIYRGTFRSNSRGIAFWNATDVQAAAMITVAPTIIAEQTQIWMHKYYDTDHLWTLERLMALKLGK